jgi:PHD/YefM family antitoxin component YafN of YafNO toxin-antitoxin module
MLDILEKQSMREFLRSARKTGRWLKRTGKPLLLTKYGRPVAVVQDPDAFQKDFTQINKRAAEEGLETRNYFQL